MPLRVLRGRALRRSVALARRMDGQSATFSICACCGCEFGYEDCLPEGVQRHRERWVANGGTWFDPTKRPASWTIEDQLSKVPRFYFRVLPGLPGTGEPPVRFNVTGMGVHSEGFVVEFTRSSTWARSEHVGHHADGSALRQRLRVGGGRRRHDALRRLGAATP